MLYAVLALVLCWHLVSAQSTVQFELVDSVKKVPLAGALIYESGTGNGSSCDSLGRAQLVCSKTGVVSFTAQLLGYQTKTLFIVLPYSGVLKIELPVEVDALDEVRITTSRTNSRIEDLPTRVEVLGLEEMKEENGIMPGNISSLLGDIAGIQMQQVSAGTGNTLARMQGLNGKYTQLLRDGLPLYGGLSGGFSIMQIPPLDLKQIEIIKGSSSTLYGGDAIGGIINLVSKDPETTPELSFTINQTSLKETNINAYTSRKYKKIGYTLFVGQTLAKACDVDHDGLSDAPFISSTVIHPKLIWYLHPKTTLTFNYNGNLDKRGGGRMSYFIEPLASAYHVISTTQRHSADFKLVHQISASGNWTFKFSNSWLKQGISTNAYSFNANQWQYYSELSRFQQVKHFSWVAGMNWNGEVFNNLPHSLSNIYSNRYYTIGAFVQNTWKPIDKLTLEGGVRLDVHSSQQIFPLPRLCILYQFNKKWSMRVNEGIGYKIGHALSNINMETDLARYVSGKALAPELAEGTNADLNFQTRWDKGWRINLNEALFYTRISSPVADSTGAFTQLYLYNAAKPVVTAGFQSYMRLQYNEFELYLCYVNTVTRKQYDAVHPLPVATPKHNVSTVLLAELSDAFALGIEASYIAGQLNQSYQKVPDYAIMALMLRYKMKRFCVVANVENLLNQRQSKFEPVYDGSAEMPVYHTLWAPVSGRVANLSLQWTL